MEGGVKEQMIPRPQTRSLDFMDNRDYQRLLVTSLIIREMQTKTTVRYHLTLVRMVVIKESTGLPWWPRVKILHFPCRGPGSDPWSQKFHILRGVAKKQRENIRPRNKDARSL